jgi:hypothetical protein
MYPPLWPTQLQGLQPATPVHTFPPTNNLILATQATLKRTFQTAH